MSFVFAHPKMAGLTPGDVAWFTAQRRLIRSKPMVQQCYDLWYSLLRSDVASVSGQGKLVELGSGAGYIKEFLPEAITSDVTPGFSDMVIDGRELPFAKNELRAILLTHCFHHIPDIRAFFREASRTLIPGGVISMVECAHTPLSRLFFGKIHPEPYLPDSKDWEFSAGSNLFDSNQALSWIVFVRDKAKFESEFPEFIVESKSYLPWFGYLLSGGVNLRSLVPGWGIGLVRFLDEISRMLDPFGAIHWHITLRKRS